MSRILGRANDVLNISTELCEAKIPKYKKNNSKTTWENIEKIKDDLSIYLPNIAIDFINKEKISIYKNPLRIYTFTSIPEYEDEKRYIRYPSLIAKKEFEREYAFSLGLLLSSYKKDNQDEFLEIGREYDEILPLLLDYLYMKNNNKENDYSLKYLNFLKVYSKKYPKSFKEYDKFDEFAFNADTYDYNEDRLEKFNNLCQTYNEDFEQYTMKHMIKLSSLDGILQIIDNNYSNGQIKELIEELIKNECETRSSILYDRGIESYGYKRLRKELNKYKVNK